MLQLFAPESRSLKGGELASDPNPISRGLDNEVYYERI
jgi:hypothetical protein